MLPPPTPARAVKKRYRCRDCHASAEVAGPLYLLRQDRPPVALAVGLWLALPLSAVLGLVGFLFGSERLTQWLGVLWGTDKGLQRQMQALEARLQAGLQAGFGWPRWLVLTILAVLLVLVWGYVLPHALR